MSIGDTGSGAKPISLVFADDSYLVREAIIRVLADDDRVRLLAVCSDGVELWAAIEEHRPDVVVTDLRMPPSGDGEALRISERLRREHPGTGVVVLTQQDDPAYGRALLAQGSEGRAYLLKERVHERNELISAIELVAAGGTAIDPTIVDTLIAASTPARAATIESLTPREQEVLALMARGKSNAAIADELVLTRRAVEKHVGAIFAKLGLDDERVTSRRVMAVLQYLADGGGHPSRGGLHPLG
jgi:DNA-binding NarL/FixJ family response regulator